MQFSLNKLHFPDEKSANFSPAPSAPAKFIAKFSLAARLRRPDPTFGGLRPPKVGVPPHPRGKKFGRRHEKIAQNRVFTVVVVTMDVPTTFRPLVHFPFLLRAGGGVGQQGFGPKEGGGFGQQDFLALCSRKTAPKAPF